MDFRKLIQPLFDSTATRQERSFRLLTAFVLSALAFAAIIALIFDRTPLNLTVKIGAFVLLYLVVHLSIKFKKIKVGSIILGIFLVYILLPLNFISKGGVYSGAELWLLCGAICVCLIIESRFKYVLLASSLLISTGCYCVQYFWPDRILPNSIDIIFIDSFCSYIVITMLSCGMILFQNLIFRMENERSLKQKKEIEELNKMQNRFFSNMSHEIRTPINTIIGLNEMILREEVSDEVAEDARNIQSASKMLLALINDILDISKIESGKMRVIGAPYDVGDMLSDIVNMIWLKSKEKGLEFHIDMDPKMPSKLIGDEVRIKQVLINILNNAVKYTETGSVTLSIQCNKIEGNNAEISYSIIDTGMGIKKENIPYLFSVFKRLDEEKNRYIEGTGLGLSIVKNLVDLMGGTVAVNSVYTKGSTFVVTIPQEIADDSAVGNFDIEAKHGINARRYRHRFEAPNASVLIVDDNEMNLMVAEKLLRDTKIKIDTSLSGTDCLKKTLIKRYDVIFMDHLMPGISGIECLHEIRSQSGGLNLKTPVVVLTANYDRDNQMLYKREGFDGYLLKPVSGTNLENELLRFLSKELVQITDENQVNEWIENADFIQNKHKIPLLVTSESVCDIPAEYIKKYGIEIIPHTVRTENGEFDDLREINAEGVISYITGGRKIESFGPSAEQFSAFFAENLTKAQHIIHFALGKDVKGGYEAAVEASKSFDNVTVIDSGHLSSGLGLMVLAAAEYVSKGASLSEVIEKTELLKSKIKTSFIVDDTAHLLRMGRISANVSRICDVFMLHPVISMKKSSMAVSSIKVGIRNLAWRKYIRAALKNHDKADSRVCFLTYSGLKESELQEIETEITRIIKFDKIIRQKASASITVNCGPGAFGVIFMQRTE